VSVKKKEKKRKKEEDFDTDMMEVTGNLRRGEREGRRKRHRLMRQLKCKPLFLRGKALFWVSLSEN